MTSCVCRIRWPLPSPFDPRLSTAHLFSDDVVGLIGDHVEQFAVVHHAPGIVWGLVANGELSRWGATGQPYEGANYAPNHYTLYRIASMTKSFTAAAVLLARDRGLLALDDPVVRHVAQLRSAALTTDAAELTVRHLLTMASGLATDDAWADRHLHATAAEMDALFGAGATSATSPGTALVYSNYGYAILGRVLESVTGMRAQDFITTELLLPLKMRYTVWQSNELPVDLVVAPPYRWLDDGVVAEPEPLGDGGFATMGGLWTTMGDLAKWVAFLCDGFPARDGVDDGPLCRASRRELQQVWRDEPLTVKQSEAGRTRVSSSGYGMGVVVTHDLDFGFMVSHGGGLPGYGSHMRWLPDRGVGVMCMANITYARMGDLSLELLELLHANAALPAPRQVDTPNLTAAVGSLVGLLNHWDNDVAGALFADNVFLDDSADRRRAVAAALAAEHGPLVITELTVRNTCEGTAVLNAGVATLEVQLSPHVQPLVQFYELTPSDMIPR